MGLYPNIKMKFLLLSLPRPIKRAIVFCSDLVICGLASWVSLALIFGAFSPLALQPLVWLWLLSLAIVLPLFVLTGLYNAIFHFIGLHALISLTKALAAYSAAFSFVVTVVGLGGVPKIVGVLQPLLLSVMAIGIRVLVRFWLDDSLRRQAWATDKSRVIIFGAGSAGRQLAGAMGRSNHHVVVGYFDDDERLWGHTLDGLKVFNPQRLSECFEKVGPQEVLLAIPSASRQRRMEIIESLRDYPVHVRTLPGLAALASGEVEVADLRELDIEDLLGRDPVPPNGLLLNRNIRSKVVMVTGAGGSIGSELCRQIVACSPSMLLLVDNNEFALYQIHQELADSGVTVLPLLASVADEPRMVQLMQVWRPHTVYHAAAFKHVPIVEHNPAQGVFNNVWGTMTCAKVAASVGVQHFVLISTDKAVRPTNVMGASKRLAELSLQALAAGEGRSTCFSMVRFGNVLGSSGSVVPLFREQIRQGGPITLTHPDITRYFMTIPEAAQLVIQAGAMAQGGDVFVLDMGQPVRILDLAKRMIELSGLTVRDEANPKGDIEIVTTGLRPGEKLFEELLTGDNPQATQHSRIMKAHESFLPWAELEPALERLLETLRSNDVPALKSQLQMLVSGYQPEPEVVDWVWVAQQKAGKTPEGIQTLA